MKRTYLSFFLLLSAIHSSYSYFTYVDSQFGTLSDDYCKGITVDDSWNTYIATYSGTSLTGGPTNGFQDVYIQKYDPLGNLTWTFHLGTNDTDQAWGITYQPNSQSLFVCGITSGALVAGTIYQSSYSSGFLLRLNAGNMSQVFVSQLQVVGKSVKFNDLSLDPNDNNVGYAVGYSAGALYNQTLNGGTDALIIQFDTRNGSFNWVRLLGSSNDDEFSDIAVDSNGNSYAVGYTMGSVNGKTYVQGADLIIAKYNKTGSLSWVTEYGTSNDEYADSVVVYGNTLYALGRSKSFVTSSGQFVSTSNYYLLLMMNISLADGTIQWFRNTSCSGGNLGSLYDLPAMEAGLDGYLYFVSPTTCPSGFDTVISGYFDLYGALQYSDIRTGTYSKTTIASDIALRKTDTSKLYFCGNSNSNYAEASTPSSYDIIMTTIIQIASPSVTPSITPSISTSPSITPSNTQTPSRTPSITPTSSISPSASTSPSRTPSNTQTPSRTPSNTPTPSITPTNSPSPSVTPSNTPSPSVTPSNSPTPSVTPTHSPSPSLTPSVTPTSSVTPSSSRSPTATPSTSVSSSVSPSFVPSSGSKHSNAGAIAGGVIGAIAAVALCGLAAGLLVRRRQSRNKSESQQPQSNSPESGTSTTTDVPLQTVSVTPSDRYLESSHWDIDYNSLKIGKELGRGDNRFGLVVLNLAGAFGVVYKAKWRNTDCVVKQLDFNKNDQQSITAFLKEANNVRHLRNHPNVCTMLGVCTDMQFPICIVMEFVPLGSLWGMITEQKITMDAETVLEFSKDVASGMGHLHKENILHCDLACRNLLVTFKDHNKYLMKIADFGLSRHLMQSDYYVASKESPFPIRWTAPETLTQHQITRASDVWSFGITVWEMAEGKIPYFGKSNSEVVEAVCNQNYRLPTPTQFPFPPALYTLMLKCWSLNPKQRPSFEELSKELDDMTEQGLDTSHQTTTTLYGNTRQYN